MAVSEEARSESEAMHELAKQLWERYFKQRVSDDLLNHSLDGYKATVITNNEDGTLTVRRPFDTVSMTLRCPPALAKKAETGDQVLVVSLGDMSNSFILCATDMEGFGSGDTGEKISLLDFSDIEELETFLVETESGVSETYTVTRDEYGRIITIEDEDGFETFVEWPEFVLTPATKISYSNTGSGAAATNVQAALDELFAGGGGGGGPALSDDDPVMDGETPSPGVSVKASRADHRHETDSSRASAAALASHVQNTSNPHGVTAAQTGAMPNTATMDDIQNGTTYAKTTAAQVAQIGTNQTNIGTIEGKIPSAASQSNQLADKAFVTDSITQGTAIFRGSFATKAALLAVAWQTTDPDAQYYVSNNDYAVVLDDETQNDECWRYIYVTGTGWTPQYRINESPLTQAQLDALNSGATAAIISSVADKLDKTGDGKDVTATFTAASTRANISTGEKLSVLFGKIAKWFSDLGTAAFRAATGSITSGSTDLVESGAVYTDVRTRVPNYGKGINLFDNSWFTVNQRGVVSGTAVNAEYFLSRWVIRRASYSISGHTVTVTATANEYGIYQPMKLGTLVTGEKYTISADIDGEIKSLTFTMPSATGYVGYLSTNVRIYIQISASSVNVWFTIPTANASFTISRSKCELGEESTLEGDIEPNYEEELIKCQTSTADSSDTYANKSLATRQDLTSIQATGTTNTTGAPIPSGAYFYLNGVLYRAKTQIDKNATFTVNTNCELATVGAALQKTVFDKQTTNGTFYDIAPGWAAKALDNVVANISNYQSGVYNVSSSGGPDFIVVLGKLNNTYYSGLIFNYSSSFFGLFQYFNGQKTLKQIAQI